MSLEIKIKRISYFVFVYLNNKNENLSKWNKLKIQGIN